MDGSKYKLCKDCKYYWPRFIGYPECNNPLLVVKNKGITNKRTFVYRYLCVVMRKFDHKCGRESKYFLQKKKDGLSKCCLD
jgi:hypothetical protein